MGASCSTQSKTLESLVQPVALDEIDGGTPSTQAKQQVYVVSTSESLVKDPRVKAHSLGEPLPEPFTPALTSQPSTLLYDPRNARENYLNWSKTRLNISQHLLSEEDIPCSPSEVSFKLVTPQISGLREMGRSVLRIDDRGQPSATEIGVVPRPQVAPGELWTDPTFPVNVAMAGLADVDWKRPPEICKKPVLFADGSSRFDVGQGSAGTCWVLSILTALADKPKYLSQIICPDSYRVGEPDYDGVFHCRLWSLGAWHDVYIDDLLPVSCVTGKLWGAYSATDDNEMWVALIEKAFARFHGSYADVKGGSAGDAFVTLTGGVQEALKLDQVTPRELFARFDNAMRAGAILACSVPEESDGALGLTGGHAYTITGIAQVPYRGRLVSLLRARNPWGTGQGEWTGAWSDGAPQWARVSQDVRNGLKYCKAMDGEFWISITNFFTYFWRAFICNFTPDFDKDGTPDGMEKVWTVLGEWSPDDDGSAIDLLTRPRYTFTITEPLSTERHHLEGADTNRSPVVIQLLQRKVNNIFLYMRCELFKVEKEWREEDGHHVLLRVMTNDTTYMGSDDVTYRFSLVAGTYMTMLTYSKSRMPETSRRYCLRLFTTDRITCGQVDWDQQTHVYVNDFKNKYDDSSHRFQLTSAVDHLGEWREGLNAGGQACRGLYHKNPQIHFEVTGEQDMPVGICISQEIVPPLVPLGIDIFRITEEGVAIPLDRSTLTSFRGIAHCAQTIQGSFLFLRGPEAAGYYMLSPGSYVAVLFSDTVADEKRFVITVATSYKTQCRDLNDEQLNVTFYDKLPEVFSYTSDTNYFGSALQVLPGEVISLSPKQGWAAIPSQLMWKQSKADILSLP